MINGYRDEVTQKMAIEPLPFPFLARNFPRDLVDQELNVFLRVYKSYCANLDHT
jgi:hypothetical protein